MIAQCYNHERFVIECLNSIKAQKYHDYELIVVDDCSTDKSPALIRDWIGRNQPLDPHFISLEENVGVCKALNRAMRVAKGEYITHVATDDIWSHHFLDRLVERFDRLSNSYGAIFSDAVCIDESGSLLHPSFIELYHQKSGADPRFMFLNSDEFTRCTGGNIFDILCYYNFIPASGIMLRSSVLEIVGYYDESLAYEDWDMWLRIAERFRFDWVSEPLLSYRIVANSLHQTLHVKDGSLNSDAQATNCKMALRLVRSKKMTNSARRMWIHTLCNSASVLYKMNDARAPAFLRQSAFLSFRPRHCLLALAATFGFSFRRLSFLSRSASTKSMAVE